MTDTYGGIAINSNTLERVRVSSKEIEGYQNRPGDLFFVRSSLKLEGVGNCCVLLFNQPQSVFECHLIRVRPDKSEVDPLFMAYLCRSPSIRKQILAFAQTTTMTTLPQNCLGKCLLPLPDVIEQYKIAEILSTWDEAIEQTRKLIETKKRCKKALMQQLLIGTRRLPGFGGPKRINSRFPGDWECLRAQDLFQVRSIKGCGNEAILSVTQDDGVVPRDALERRIEASEANTDSYKLVAPGDFVISLRSFQGGIEYSRFRGIVSPAYHVIRPKKRIDDTYYKYYFKSYDFVGHLAVAVIGIRDGKQVSYNDFSFMNLPYPTVTEQKAIGHILSASDQEIEILESKLNALEKQKRGLMQKLLTGEVRVNV